MKLKDRLKKLGQGIRRAVRPKVKTSGGALAVLLAGILMVWGVPPQQAQTAGIVAGEIFDNMKGGRSSGEESEAQQ